MFSADARIIEAFDVRTNNSVLTGESYLKEIMIIGDYRKETLIL